MGDRRNIESTMKKIPLFNSKIYQQFLKDCDSCSGVQIEIKTPQIETNQVAGWDCILPAGYDANKDSNDDHACVITDWSDTYGDIKIPFSAFMSHKKPRFDGVSYILSCIIDGDPLVKFTFLYPKIKQPGEK